MVCKKCNNEVLDENATYCGACGSRLDGKKTCPACKKPNEENVTYCVYCGERMDGKTVCSACGTAYNGQFCPSCGKSELVMKRRGGAGYNKEKVLHTFDVVGSGLMMLGVLFALIFVFFIAVTVDVSVIKIADLGLDSDASIFDYFGKYYEEIGEVEAEMKWFYDTMSSQELIIGIIGTVIAALTLCAVVGFAITATIIFVRNWMGLSERKADKWAIATILSFFAGVVTFLGLHKFGMSYNGVEGMLKLSSATVWGIVLCSIALVGSIACKIVAGGSENLQRKQLVRLSLALLGVAFCATLFGIMGNFNILSKMTAHGESLTISAGAMVANILAIACAEQKVEWLPRGTETDSIFSNVETFTVLNTVTQIILILAVVAIILCIMQKLNGVLFQKQSSELVWAIVAVVLTVACLVLSILSKNSLSEICDVDASLSSGIQNNIPDVEGSIAIPILLVVFSVLNLAVACVHSVLNSKWKKSRQAE